MVPIREFEFGILNSPVDISKEFAKLENTYFNSKNIISYDSYERKGIIEWKRYSRKISMAFNQIMVPYEEGKLAEFPPEYDESFALPFSLSFVSPRTVRLQIKTRPNAKSPETSLMLLGEPPVDCSWKTFEYAGYTEYRSKYGSVIVNMNPFRIEFRDAQGRLLIRSMSMGDSKCLQNTEPTPFSFVRKASDLKRHIAASFSLSPDEMIFGCGESFTRLNKRGQKLILYTFDNHGTQNREMYKPVPFFMSSRGYGMFIHTSTPITCDFGYSYDQAATLYIGDESLDLFVFIGSPKEILSEYTSLTGRSPLPPLWSFGLWMSRITYKSEEEIRGVAAKLREYNIPCDVIHLDTGWFEKDWRCDYRFSTSRFKDPQKMITDLKKQGFHICLWQLPYFTPTNMLYREAIDNGYVVLDSDGNLPTEDAIIDFSNPEAVKWYQQLLSRLFEMGVEAIKADFGECAPFHGKYASGKSGFYEHNLYPLRYNKAVSDITKEKTGSSIIWARSAWAGSQRYPLHWGGDAENTDSGMAASLRAGLSLGLCGFSFWSHDIGGFVTRSPEELYRRWMPFGMLTSHSRCHGAPPKEPWHYGEKFVDDFRRAVELKYRIMPYIYSQAALSSMNGFPMMRTLFFEFPDDKTSWFIEDEYMFGSDMLVAPIMHENASGRDVYLPEGIWIDYQTHRRYEGGRWSYIECAAIPCIILVKNGTIMPEIKLAQSTSEMDWENIDLLIYETGLGTAECYICLPEDGIVRKLVVKRENDEYFLTDNPLPDKVKLNIKKV